MTWSDDPTRQCHHHVEVLVDAPLDVCFGIWLDWKKLINFLDLVQQARPPLGAHIATVTAVAAVLHILTLCPALLRYCRSGWTTIPQTWLYSSASIVGVSVALLRLCLRHALILCEHATQHSSLLGRQQAQRHAPLVCIRLRQRPSHASPVPLLFGTVGPCLGPVWHSFTGGSSSSTQPATTPAPPACHLPGRALLPITATRK